MVSLSNHAVARFANRPWRSPADAAGIPEQCRDRAASRAVIPARFWPESTQTERRKSLRFRLEWMPAVVSGFPPLTVNRPLA